MNCPFKTTVLAAAIAATALATMPANAGDRHWRHYGGHGAYYPSYPSGNDLAVAGILGLAAGALVVGLAAQPEPVYATPDPWPRPRPVPVYGSQAYYGALEPWSDGWYDYCMDRYRSFQPRTGTFTGYDGRQHFCTAD